MISACEPAHGDSAVSAASGDIANERRRSIKPPAIFGFQPFSLCQLFSLQTEFYDDQGLGSWACGMVPQFITSNAWVAAAYAETIISSWAPYAQATSAVDVAPRFTILELGAGSGKLAHGLLRVLLPRADALLGRRCASRIRYIMTDAAPSVVRGWMQQPQLMAFARAGLMDFAVLAAERSEWAAEGIKLLYSGELWRPWEEAACGATAGSAQPRAEAGGSAATTSSAHAAVHPPVIAIAGYVLDSLPLDVWRVQAGSARSTAAGSSSDAGAAGPRNYWQLLQGLVRLRWDGGTSGDGTSAAGEKPSSSAAAIKSFRADWRFVHEHEVPMVKDADGAADAEGSTASSSCSCCAGTINVGYYQRQHQVGVDNPSATAASSAAPSTAAASNRKAHVAALAGACAAAADRVLDWYLAHGCETDMHEAFACDYAPPAADPLVASGCGADGDDEGAAGCVASGSSAAAALLDGLKAAAPGPHSLAASQHKMFACTATGRTQPLPARVVQGPDGSVASVFEPSAAGVGAGSASEAEAGVAAAPQATFSTFCLPIGPMRALANLLAFTTWAAAASTSTAAAGASSGSSTEAPRQVGAALPALRGPGFLLLCADKGLLHPASFVGALLPDVHRHGSFSTMVNFHALGLWTQILANADHDYGAGSAGSAACSASLESATAAAGPGAAGTSQQQRNVTAVLVSPADDVNIKTALFALVPRQVAAAAVAAVRVVESPLDSVAAAATLGTGTAGHDAASALAAAQSAQPAPPAFLDLCTHGELAGAADRFYSSLVAFGPSDVFDLYHALSRASPSPLLAYTYGAASGKYERVGVGAGKRRRSGDGTGSGVSDVAALLVAASSGGTEGSSDGFGHDVHAEAAGAGAGEGHVAAAAPTTTAAEAEAADTLLCSDSESDSASDAGSDSGAEDTESKAQRDGNVVLRSGAAASLQRRSRPRRSGKKPGSSSASAAIAQLPLIAGRHASAHRFLSLRAAVALCALLHWDGDAVHQFRGIFALRLRTLTPPRRHSLWSGLLAAWAGAYLPVLPPAASDDSDDDSDSSRSDHDQAGSAQAARSQAARKGAAAARAPSVSSQLSEYDVPFDIGRIVQIGAAAAPASASADSDGDGLGIGDGSAGVRAAASAASEAQVDGYPSHLAAAQAWYLESMRRVSPRCPTTAYNLALCCLGLGQQGLARGWLAAALAYSGGKHVHAAQCLRELQDQDEDDDDSGSGSGGKSEDEADLDNCSDGTEGDADDESAEDEAA